MGFGEWKDVFEFVFKIRNPFRSTYKNWIMNSQCQWTTFTIKSIDIQKHHHEWLYHRKMNCHGLDTLLRLFFYNKHKSILKSVFHYIIFDCLHNWFATGSETRKIVRRWTKQKIKIKNELKELGVYCVHYCCLFTHEFN